MGNAKEADQGRQHLSWAVKDAVNDHKQMEGALPQAMGSTLVPAQ